MSDKFILQSHKQCHLQIPEKREQRWLVLPDEILATAVVLKLEVQDPLTSEQRSCSSQKATAQISHQAPGNANYVGTSILQCDNFFLLNCCCWICFWEKRRRFCHEPVGIGHWVLGILIIWVQCCERELVHSLVTLQWEHKVGDRG